MLSFKHDASVSLPISIGPSCDRMSLLHISLRTWVFFRSWLSLALDRNQLFSNFSLKKTTNCFESGFCLITLVSKQFLSAFILFVNSLSPVGTGLRPSNIRTENEARRCSRPWGNRWHRRRILCRSGCYPGSIHLHWAWRRMADKGWCRESIPCPLDKWML